MASAAGASVVEPVTTFSIITQPGSCAGGTQSPLIEDLQALLQSLGYPGETNFPTISLNPGCANPAPAALSSIISASNTAITSPSGSATVTSKSLGNPLFAEVAYTAVDLTASVPLSAPAPSVDLSIPYTTSGVAWSSAVQSDVAEAVVAVSPYVPTLCADGSEAVMSPSGFRTPSSTPTPASSGTLSYQISCPDGADIVSGVGFVVALGTYTYSGSGHAETATANITMHNVTATINS